jgi:mycothiol synthase
VTGGPLIRILQFMEGHLASRLTFGAASPAELPAALELLFNRLDLTFRAAQVAVAWETIEKSGGDGQIVLVARRGSAMAAAIWVQVLPGRVASLWQPGLAAGEPASSAAAMIELAIARAGAAGVRLIQTRLETDAGPEADLLQQCAFRHIADLLYLVSLSEEFPNAAPTELVFEPVGKAGEMGISEIQMKRLSEVIRRTYIETQDCPDIHGLRPVEDVLATYQNIGRFNPARWFVVRLGQSDIGCLILADHPDERNCELIYMGIVPEARGCGRGVEIVRYAQWLAGKGSERDQRDGKNAEQNAESAIQRLVLAVDAANSPAIAMYAAAGFQTWDRRSVFLREIAANI